MQRFKNILVGVDLSGGDQLVADRLAPPTRTAVERAMWLAKLNAARLHFFHALDVSAAVQRVLQERPELEGTVLARARESLIHLVAEAEEEGIDASCSTEIGVGWLQMIRSVLREKHDLVVVGTRHLGRLSGMLLGSTGMKLLRKCPCPVWVTQPQDDARIRRILVPTDFSPVCDFSIALGTSLAQLEDSELHIVHAFDASAVSHLRGGTLSDDELSMHHGKFQSDAELQLYQQLRRSPLDSLPRAPHRHFVPGKPAEAIKQLLDQLDIQLLIMGTVNKTGIAGMLMGSTAERLLPQINCSLLAVKPSQFQSPIRL